jgi:hypothetical protein
MKKGIILTAMMTSMVIYLLPSCYKNKEDILALPKVSFRSEVVPIMVAGGCGCHNTATVRAVQFSHADSIFYDAILARTSVFETMVNGGEHPGGGEIYFKPNENTLIKQWIEEGAKDDGGGCTVTGPVTYTADIEPIYKTTCTGSTCHGGLAIPLDYDAMIAEKNTLISMINTGGDSHPGGAMSLSTCTVNIFVEWIDQGMPK